MFKTGSISLLLTLIGCLVVGVGITDYLHFVLFQDESWVQVWFMVNSVITVVWKVLGVTAKD